MMSDIDHHHCFSSQLPVRLYTHRCRSRMDQ